MLYHNNLAGFKQKIKVFLPFFPVKNIKKHGSFVYNQEIIMYLGSVDVNV